jgi:hypothetical protein
MNNRLVEWGRSFYAEGTEGLTPHPDFIQIKIHIVGRLFLNGCSDSQDAHFRSILKMEAYYGSTGSSSF